MKEDEYYNMYLEVTLPDTGDIGGETLIGLVNLEATTLEEAGNEVKSILLGFRLDQTLTVKSTLRAGKVLKEVFYCFRVSKDEYWRNREAVHYSRDI